VIWDPTKPSVIPAQGQIQSWLPLAAKAGVNIVVAVGAAHPNDLLTPGAAGQFAAFVAKVAKTFPQVKNYVIGNEPNRPYFSQPTFAEGGRHSFATRLTLDLDEIGWEVGVLPSLASLYTGVEPKPPIDEPTQALYYTDVITTAECDQNVRTMSFFLLEDEANLTRWQSGLERVDGSHRPSYDAVKQTMAQTHGNCLGEPLPWSHTSQVMAPFVGWRMPGRVKRTRTSWHFSAGAEEEVTYRAGIFKARTS